MIFFPEGDKEKGLEQLKFVAENGKYAKIEARYFLMTLYYRYEEDYQNAIKYAEMLLKQFPDNPTFQRYYGRIYIRQNDYITGAKIFSNILAKCNKNLRGYNKNAEREASYYLGMKYKNANQPDSARVYFELSEKLSRQLDVDEESGFLINTVLYLGMIYDQLGMRDKAIKYYKEVLDFRERNNSHELAEQYLKKPYK
jgi:tetratricopeptide (TPR) repeat protein